MQVVTPVIRLIVVAVIPVFLAGCKTPAAKGKKQESPAALHDAEPKAMKIPIGTIHHVDAGGGFVLIQSTRANRIEPDTEITVVGDGGEVTSILKVSQARKGPFISADILNGIPQSGQKVLMDHTPRPQGNPFQSGPPVLPTGSEVQVLE